VAVATVAKTSGAKKIGVTDMKKTQTEMAARYKLAEQIVWNSLENWQKIAITEDRKLKKTSTVFDAFTAKVIALAENKSSLEKAKKTKPTEDKITVDSVSRIK
jgi:hypothetical protein